MLLILRFVKIIASFRLIILALNEIYALRIYRQYIYIPLFQIEA